MPATERKTERIFIGYLDTCAFFSSIRTGFLENNRPTVLLHLGNATYDGWNPNDLPLIPGLYYRAYKRFWGTRDLPRLSPRRILASATILLLSYVLLAWQVLRFDVFIFKSGESLFANQFDFRVLKFFGKKIIFYYQGSDSRPPYLVGLRRDDAELPALRDFTRQIWSNLRKVEDYADIVIANPLSAQFHQKKVCTAQIIGNTIDATKTKPGHDYLRDHPVWGTPGVTRILHAPSAIELKGTDRIRALIETLRAEGHAIDYVEITGRPQSEVMVELARCDIVIDELYSDSHGGMLALEACAFGKPVVVCGYGADELARFIPPDAVMPTLFCHPDRLKDAVLTLIASPEARDRAAANARAYFAKGSPKEVTKRFLEVIRGEVSEAWFVDPADIRYVEGVAGSPDKLASTVKRYVERFGPEALLLDDKPVLKQRLLDLAFGPGQPSTTRDRP